MEEINHLNSVPYQLIIDELEGKISSGDLLELERWKSASAVNLEQYHEVIALSTDLELLAQYKKADSETAWKRFNPEAVSESTPVLSVAHNQIKRFTYKWLAAAAVVVIVSVCFFQGIFHKEVTIRTAEHEHRKIVLPDGTEVHLNENTVMAYQEAGFKTSRKLKLLSGEAFFEVDHQEDNPFSIKAGEVEVKDIGTSFDLKVDQKQVVVVVNSGQVALNHKGNNESVILSPKDKGVFDKVSKKITAGKNAALNYKSWHDQKLQFIESPLTDVARDIEAAFGNEVVFQDATLKDRKVTAYFEKQSADDIMHVVALTLQLKLEKRAGVFYLSK